VYNIPMKKEEIKTRMAKNGIPMTAMYMDMVPVIEKALHLAIEIGYDQWAQKTTFGPALRQVVRDMV